MSWPLAFSPKLILTTTWFSQHLVNCGNNCSALGSTFWSENHPPPTHKKILFLQIHKINSPHAPFLSLFLPLHLLYPFIFHFPLIPLHFLPISSTFFSLLLGLFHIFASSDVEEDGTYFPICTCLVSGSIILSSQIWNPISLVPHSKSGIVPRSSLLGAGRLGFWEVGKGGTIG